MAENAISSNPFRIFWDAGFRDLIPVIPPDAELSPGSRIHPSDRGKAPGLLNGDGRWHGIGWRNLQATESDLEGWHAAGASTGIRGDHVIGVDIDCTDAALSARIGAFVVDALGPAPVRIGRAPKQLLVYRTDTAIPSRRIWFVDAAGTKHCLELLAQGRQFVAAGIHPVSREPYRWAWPDGWARQRDALHPVEPAAAETLFTEQIIPFLEAAGCAFLAAESGTTDRSHIDQDQLRGDLDLIRTTVDATPNTNTLFPTRPDYLRFGYAIKAALADHPDEAKELFLSWAMRWEGNDANPDGNDYETASRDWDRMTGPYAIGSSYLLDRAFAGGVGLGSAVLAFADLDQLQELGGLPPEARKPEWPIKPVDFADIADQPLKEREWVLGRRFMRRAITVGAGAPGVSKSMFANLSALAIATGTPLTGEPVHRPGPVWIHNNEDDTDELHRRVHAILLQHRAGPVPRGRLFLSSGQDENSRKLIVAKKLQDGAVVQTPHVPEVLAYIRAHGIAHAVFDPFVSTHSGVAENSNEEIEAVLAVFRRIAADTGISIDLIHHTVKQHSGDPERGAGDMNAARGAGALIGAVRSAYTLSAMGPDTAKRLHIDAGRSARMVRLDDAKGNYSVKVKEARWFEMVSVPFGTEGDSVGVHVPFDLVQAKVVAEMSEATERVDAQDAFRIAVVRLMDEHGGFDRYPAVRLYPDLGRICQVSTDSGDRSIRRWFEDCVPAGIQVAAEVTFEGATWRVWQVVEERGRRKRAVVHRRRVGASTQQSVALTGAIPDPFR